MKKLLTIILLCLLSQSTKVSAQFTYEHTYTITAPGMESPFYTNLGNNNYKYVIYDYYNDKFSLYNIDHTPFLLNVMLPVSTDSGQTYEIGYITNSLFDCDSATIEYALFSSSPNNGRKFMVYRTDGTLVFSKDSVTIPYAVAVNNGSVEIRGINNTNAGTKLWLFNKQLQFFVYGLCGVLPDEINEIYHSNNYVNVSPIPSATQVHFIVTPPSNFEEYELIILNSTFQTIKTFPVSGRVELNLNDGILNSGNYFFSLKNRNKIFQTGKFIISK